MSISGQRLGEERLQKLLDIEAEASAGPWGSAVQGGERLIVRPSGDDEDGEEEVCRSLSVDDATLITAARNNLPDLIADLRAERHESTKLRVQNEQPKEEVGGLRAAVVKAEPIRRRDA